MSNKRLKEKIIRDIERSVKNASYEIALDMQKRYEYVIQAFYNDYSPNSYTVPNPLKRTGSLFLGSNGYSYSFDKNHFMPNDISYMFYNCISLVSLIMYDLKTNYTQNTIKIKKLSKFHKIFVFWGIYKLLQVIDKKKKIWIGMN